MLNMPKKTAAQKPGKSAAVSKPKAGKGGREALLARIEQVRHAQRSDGHFDCFAKAQGGYCDQVGCAYHAECLSMAQRL